MSDHSELKKLADAATPGPWGYSGSYIAPLRTEEDGASYVEMWRPVAQANNPENSKFIAAANPAVVLALIAEVEELRKDADRFGFIEQDASSGMSKIYGDDWVSVIDAAMNIGAKP